MNFPTHPQNPIVSHVVTVAALGVPWVPNINGAVEIIVGIAAFVYYTVTLRWGFQDRAREHERDRVRDQQFSEKQAAEVIKASVLADATVKAEAIKAVASVKAEEVKANSNV